MARGLLEICCDADSELGLAAEARGLVHERITLEDRFDLARGVAKARSFVAH